MLPVHLVALQDSLQLADQLLRTEGHKQLEERLEFLLAVTCSNL